MLPLRLQMMRLCNADCGQNHLLRFFVIRRFYDPSEAREIAAPSDPDGRPARRADSRSEIIVNSTKQKFPRSFLYHNRCITADFTSILLGNSPDFKQANNGFSSKKSILEPNK